MMNQIGPYRVEEEIGRGGMGVVYRAIDERLDRLVAIKALPPELASDASRLERFEREAKSMASLNHPNVAGIHGVEEFDGSKYLVLEFIEGETLADVLDRGPIQVDDAIELAVQIAAGIEAAHEAGVIHRDLKPANIMITTEGVAKVLDFGLAKSDEGATSSSGITQDLTLSRMGHSPTIPGMILGTAAYMSPEQARGRKVDKRTDIWSFGVLLYEMLAGASPFVGETVTDSIGAVLHKDVELDRLPNGTPNGVKRVLSRCVERDKAFRYRDIGDVRIELLRAKTESIDVPASRLSRSPLVLAVACLAVLVVGVFGVLIGRTASSTSPSFVTQMTIEAPAGTTIKYSGDQAGPVVVSPDGSMVVFSAAKKGERQRLWVRRLAQRDAIELSGTDGAMFPFWSPDNKSIGFFTQGSLRRINLASQTTITVCETGVARGGTWTSDGRIIFSPRFSTPLVIVDAAGGDSEWLTEFEKDPEDQEEFLHSTHRWPQMLPDGKHFLFLAAHREASSREHQAIYLGSLDGAAPRRLMRSDYGAAFHDGWIIFVREGVLLASKIDFKNAKLTGELRVVAKDVAGDLSTWHGQFSVGGDVLVYNRLSSSRNDLERTLAEQAVFGFEGDQVTHIQRDGRVATNYAVGVPHSDMSASPDGRSIAISVPGDDGSLDLWIYPTAFVPVSPEDMTDEIRDAVEDAVVDPDPTRFTFLDGNEDYQVWSPDSQKIAFAWAGEGVDKPGIYSKTIGGGTQELLLESTGDDLAPEHWSPDGKYLIYLKGDFQYNDINNLWALPLDGTEPFPLVESEFGNIFGRVSPGGKWLAYCSNQSGTREVYVIPFEPGWQGASESPGGVWQISQGGGVRPLWSSDGSELFYVKFTGMLMSVEIDLQSDSFRTAATTELFESPFETGSSFAISPDSPTSGFLFTDHTQDPNAAISAILNWQQLLSESDD